MSEYIASFKKTAAILKAYQLSAHKSYGQNFLVDANVAGRIAEKACSKEMITLEIGPGIGALTEFLALNSLTVYAHEIDKKLISVLEETLKAYSNVEIIPGDFLSVDFKTMPYYDKALNVCANLPYYITSPLLFKLFESDLKLKQICVMVQKEVAERFLAKVGSKDYNALSVIAAYRYHCEQLLNVSRHVFYPKPKVDSAVISFHPRLNKEKVTDEKAFFQFIKTAFKQRRKTLFNNLKDEFKEAAIIDLLADLNLEAKVRAQELTLKDFMHLYEGLKDEKKSVCQD